MQLLNSKEQEKDDGSTSDSETDSKLVGLIEGIHNHYQSLYTRNRSRKERQASASSTSSSDSDYHSSEDFESNNGKLRNGQQEMSATEENEASDSENLEPLRKTQASEEGQISGIKLELEALRAQKIDLESQCAKKTSEAKQLEKENEGLQKKLKDSKNDLVSKIEDLKAQVSCLQMEVDSSRASEKKSTGLVNGLRDQVNLMQRDLITLTRQKSELELLLQEKNKEISEYQIQIKNLKDEQNHVTAVGQRMLKEKESYLVRVKDLVLELESLSSQKNKLEEQLDSKLHDTKLLREEKKSLQGRISELSDQLSALQRSYEGREKEASTQILALNAQVQNLQQDLHDLQSQRSQQEQHNKILTTKLANQESILKEQDETINRLTDESREVNRRMSGSKINLQVAERRMSELAEEFRKTFEDNIRVLNRRILVAEQLHNENKESYKKTKERLEEEYSMMEKKIATHEIELRKLRDVFQPGSKSLPELNIAAGNFEGNGDLLSRISEISTDLVFAKNWVTDTLHEKNKLQKEVKCLAEKLDDKEEQESLLKDKVLKLEANLEAQGGEKMNLLKTVSQLERLLEELKGKIEAKEERLSSLAEEKREAIRQLCAAIDSIRGDYNHLRHEISKKTLQTKK